MAKQGMKRPERTHIRPRNSTAPVPELQGSAKHTDAHANPLIPGTASPTQKVYHTRPHASDKAISHAYPEIDNDLAQDNLENDIPEADLQDQPGIS